MLTIYLSKTRARFLFLIACAMSLEGCYLATMTPASRTVMLETGRVARPGEVGVQGHIALEAPESLLSDGKARVFGGHVRVGVADSVEASLSGQAVYSQQPPDGNAARWVDVSRWGMTYRLGFRFQLSEGSPNNTFRPALAIGVGGGGSYIGDRWGLGADLGLHFSIENRIFTPFFSLSIGISGASDTQPRLWLTGGREISVPISSATTYAFLIGGRFGLHPDCESICPSLLIAGGFRGSHDLEGEREIGESSAYGLFAQVGIEFLFRT